MPSRLILVPVDLAGSGEARLAIVEQYARALDADILLLHVLPPGTLDPSSVLPVEASARTYLHTVAARLRNAGLRAETLLRSGQPAATIVEEAHTHASDLIVLGANIRPSLSTAVLGSVADQVARAAPCPVLLVRPQGPPQRPRALRSFHEDAERAGVLVQRTLGLRTIEVARIVGSVGRFNELGPDFRPPPNRRRGVDADRFNRIKRAMQAGAEMPPIDVYKIGFGYYVLDGHHRLAVALENGQLEIDAVVTEFVEAADEQAPELFAARRAFERDTALTDVGATLPESYVILRDSIERFRVEQGLNEMPRAASRWYLQIFRPMWQAIRARQLSSYFPGERTADLFARLTAWKQVEAPDLDWPSALDAFVQAQGLVGASSTSSRKG
jgi:nucleotide-binding universal stress UspA family protein